MSFFKKFRKLDDIAFHLVKYSNKNKLKLNLLISKNWIKIIGTKFNNFAKLREVRHSKQSDSLTISISCDPSIVLELRSDISKIKLNIEQIVGIKVQKINFYQDIFTNTHHHIDKNEILTDINVKKVNKNKLNDIKEDEISSIFERINLAIKNEKN